VPKKGTFLVLSPKSVHPDAQFLNNKVFKNYAGKNSFEKVLKSDFLVTF